MVNYFTKLMKDLDNENLPKNLDNLDKIKCDLMSGKRVYWYFKEDLEFFSFMNRTKILSILKLIFILVFLWKIKIVI